MAGNSFDLYDRYTHSDLFPHLHRPGAASLIIAVYWVRTRFPSAPALPERRWLLEATIIGTSLATTLHVLRIP